MSDKITTLHLKNDPSTNIYPNVKIENIPLDVTIAQGGANLATSGTIYDYLQTNFISVNEDGDITREISSTHSGYKVTIGNGLLTLTALDEEDVTTFKPYGLSYYDKFFGYPDPDENDVNGDLITNKWSGFSEYAKKEDLENYAKKEDYPTYGDISEFTPNNVEDIINSSSGYYEIKNKTIRICGYINATAHEQSNMIYFRFVLPSAVGANISAFVSTIAGLTNGSILLSTSGGKESTAAYLYKFSDTSFAIRFGNSFALNGIYAFDIIVPYNA